MAEWEAGGGLSRAAGLGVPGASLDLPLHYLPDWQSHLRAFPLSPQLPLGGEATTASAQWRRHAALYLAHLLPGGAAERGVAQALDPQAHQAHPAQASIKRNALEGLPVLMACGDDLPGAVGLRGRRRSPPWMPQRELLPESLADRLQGPAEQWLLLDERGERVLPWWPAPAVGAGAMDSLPMLGVYVDQGRWWWTRTPQMASTHLLEAAPRQAGGEAALFNKLFCLRLAARLGLDVATVELLPLPQPVLQFQRWDRLRLDDGRVRRLHAVSAGQALGLWPDEHTASTHPPPPWTRLGKLLSHSPQPLVDRRALMRWWVFQALIGSGDAGPSDLWFYLDHTGLRLAPVMNLRCPLAPHGKGSWRGATGGPLGRAELSSRWQMTPPVNAAKDWALAAKACGAKPRSLALELRRMCEAAPLEASVLASAAGAEVPADVAHAIAAVVAAQSARQMAWVEDLLHTDHRDL
ncbi:HipA domain-containing protein [Roseateles sp. SL47]|uniref:HipA domain-containing protein n=1 Tax=Roseateles sp. SL47 TaxID=2995138 RepID=UPI00226F3524|nr:HipA domain-containing protein [Roseateles sp. SL47]WAC72602.1 HipA domain-containing protein [Roseateles sp. SL47]